jgi:hypothetical protein
MPRAISRSAAAALAAVAALTFFPETSFAQGRGKALGRLKSGTPTAGTVAVAATTVPTSSIQFGSWLDDASVLPPGEAWTALSFGYFRAAGHRQTGFPMLDASLGVARRVTLGVTVPYYRLHLPDGTGGGALGDIYVSSKIMLIDTARSSHGFGVAVSPMLEALAEPEPNGNRYSWAAPVSVEWRADDYRVFGSAGFFSRGVFFSSGALEIPLTDRVAITGALTAARSLDTSPEEKALAISRNRTDISGVAAYFLTPSIGVFGGVGRTLGSDPFGTSFMLVSGVSMTFPGHGVP